MNNNRKNFHRIENPRKAVSEFFAAELKRGYKVYWDKSHITNHDNGGVGMYFCSAAPGSEYDHEYVGNYNRFMLIRSEADIEDVFTHYEDDE